jgi:CP family cyanate transporter-like MFS transporter
MNNSALPKASERWLSLFGIFAIATSLRATFTGIAPLLGDIRSVFGLTTAETGLLTTLPLLAFALASPLAARLVRHIGMERSLCAALVLICIGITLRSAGRESQLWAGTFIIGCGIALGNVLLPAIIKRDFPGHVARLTGAYSLTMGVAAAVGSALMVPIASAGFGWRGALLALSFFPLLALLLWLGRLRSRSATSLAAASVAQGRTLWRSPLAWQVTLFLGLNSLIYYVVVGWLPAILVSHGMNAAQAGSLHGLMQLATAAPGLFIGLLLARLKDQRGIAALVALLCGVSVIGLWLLPGLAALWVTLFGFGSGATMILGLTFIGLRAGTAHQAAALSGMAQSVGYLLAACGPPAIGKLHDASHGWGLALAFIALITLVMAWAGACAGRNRELTPEPHTT